MPTSTIYAVLAVIAAAQGLFFALVLFTKKENRLPNRLIAGLLLLLAVTLLEWACWWSGLIRQYPWMIAVSAGFPWLYGVLMYHYFKAVFEKKPLVWWWVHWLPFFANLFFMLPFYLRFFPEWKGLINWIPQITRLAWFPVFLFGQMIFYGIWMTWRFRDFFRGKKELEKWRRWLLAAYWGIVLTYIVYRLLPYAGLNAPEWKYLIAGSLTFFIYLAAWLGYIEPRIFAGELFTTTVHPVKYYKSSLAPAEALAMFAKIMEMMEQDKPYKNSQFSIEGLAARLSTRKHHVSQAINQCLGKSFSQMVSEYRVREAQALLATKSKKELHVIEVAYEVGFNTKEAFNLAFKKISGMTPGEFRQSQQSPGIT